MQKAFLALALSILMAWLLLMFIGGMVAAAFPGVM